MNTLDFSVLTPYASLLPAALRITIEIGVSGFVLGTLIAVIVGSCRSKKMPKIIEIILNIYVEIFRGTPLLVQLFFVYYGLPSMGIKLEPILAAILTMGLNSGSYLSENVRAAILAVDKGQYEAAHMLGYNSLQTNIHIVLPQAMRIAIPSFMNGFSSIIKETSIVIMYP